MKQGRERSKRAAQGGVLWHGVMPGKSDVGSAESEIASSPAPLHPKVRHEGGFMPHLGMACCLAFDGCHLLLKACVLLLSLHPVQSRHSMGVSVHFEKRMSSPL